MDAKTLHKTGIMNRAQLDESLEFQKRESELNHSGRYTPPRELNTCGIPTAIVDPHNEVLPYWENVGKGAVVIHVDKHDDMGDNVLASVVMQTDDSLHRKLDEMINGRDQNPEFGEQAFSALREIYGLDADEEMIECNLAFYASPVVGIGNFIIAASYRQFVSVIYHINPGSRGVMAYGRIVNGSPTNLLPITRDSHRALRWDKTLGVPISTREMIGDLRAYRGKLILDIDLDGFACFDDRQYKKRLENQLHKAIEKRFAKLKMVATNVQKPDLITIARSQTPEMFTPPELVDSIEARTIEILTDAYK